MKKLWLAFCWLLMGGLAACLRATPMIPESVVVIAESPVRVIAMDGPAAKAKAEISGMAWCGEHLVLLPQYPMMYADDQEPGYLFRFPAQAVDAYLLAVHPQAIQPELLPIDTKGIERLISGFEGFESILFNGNDVYLTIESHQDDGMMGYLVRGEVNGECERLEITQEEPTALPPQADLGNMSDETLVLLQDQLITIYEANGVNVNPDPVAHRFDFSLEPSGILAMPSIEYRITDATLTDKQGEFWAVNYFFPGNAKKLKPDLDQIAIKFGLGVSHQDQDQVERLIALKFDGDRIILADKPPVYPVSYTHLRAHET